MDTKDPNVVEYWVISLSLDEKPSQTKDTKETQKVDSWLPVSVMENVDQANSIVVFRSATIQQAEDYIAILEKSNPAKVHAGVYSINYPEDFN